MKNVLASQELNSLVRKLDEKLLRGLIRRLRNQFLFARADRISSEKILVLKKRRGFALETHYSRSPHNSLSELCDVYGSDKGEVRSDGHPYWWPSHTYADYVSRLFGHCRESIHRVFECGLGTNNPDLASSMGVDGKPGASLRVWRDYFPNAMVYGADIDKEILFQEERISTYWVDQTSPEAVQTMWAQIGGTIDLIVDDGLHEFQAGRILFENSIDYLADRGVYIIEDVNPSDLLSYEEYFSQTPYFVDFVVLHRKDLPVADNCLVVIRKEM